MKTGLWTLIAIILTGCFSAFAQRTHEVQVYPGETASEDTGRLLPGLFYFQFYDPGAVSLFRAVSTPGMYNCLRETKFYSECWRYSESRDDLLRKMDETGLRDHLRSLQTYTDRVVVKINGMPFWLSSSSSLDVLGDASWREFMTHPPRDWDAWENAVEAAAAKIASWNMHPYYEIWNEPDGEYWKGSDEELLELYRRTALAIRRADPAAKVGGVGMHTWWRSVDPRNTTAQQPFMGALYGHKPDALPERYALLYQLLDSVRGNWEEQQVPLDFISFHHFNHNRRELGRIAQQLRSKMAVLGYCPPGEACPSGRPFPELYISEWQTTYGAQEQLFQPSLFLSLINEMGTANITFHSIAALADFSTSADDEFIFGWGMLSGSHLVKPVYRALQLLDAVLISDRSARIEAGDLTSWAGMKGDTLRMLLSHYNMPPVWYSQYPKVGWSAFERLLYDESSTFTQQDFIAAGHNSIYWGAPDWGSIDRIFRGELPPSGSSPAMAEALRLARQQYVDDSTANAGPHSLHVRIEGAADSVRGFLIRIDSTHNNIIFLYDSLRDAGYTHQRAVDSLQSATFAGGWYGLLWEKEDIVFIHGDLTIEADPNSVLFLQLDDVRGTAVVARLPDDAGSIAAYPSPVSDRLQYSLEKDAATVQVSLLDIHGRIVRSANGSRGQLDCTQLPAGMYLLLARSADGRHHTKRILVQP